MFFSVGHQTAWTELIEFSLLLPSVTWKVGYLAWNSLLPASASPLCLLGRGSGESDPLGTSVVHTLYDAVGESVALHSGRSIETS